MTDIPGAAYKATCRVASTANITTLSGLLTIDGIVLVANDRVLVKDQTASQNNGIYIASAGAWVRSVEQMFLQK
jgi:phage-related tail fiber protein